MLNAYHIAAVGLQAEQRYIEIISQNVSNMNTPAYKKLRPVFQDILLQSTARPVSESKAAGLEGPGFVGRGVALGDTRSVWQVGEQKVTGRALDWVIDGQGFFEAVAPDGESVYFRNGALQVDGDGYLVNEQGYPLAGQLRLPPGWNALQVDVDGTVSVRVDDGAERMVIGYLELATFMNPDSLVRHGGGLYRATVASGMPDRVRPGDYGAGFVTQGALEASNVDMVEELLQMMLAQRAYQANSQVLRAADTMWQTVNALRS